MVWLGIMKLGDKDRVEFSREISGGRSSSVEDILSLMLRVNEVQSRICGPATDCTRTSVEILVQELRAISSQLTYLSRSQENANLGYRYHVMIGKITSTFGVEFLIVYKLRHEAVKK